MSRGASLLAESEEDRNRDRHEEPRPIAVSLRNYLAPIRATVHTYPISKNDKDDDGCLIHAEANVVDADVAADVDADDVSVSLHSNCSNEMSNENEIHLPIVSGKNSGVDDNDNKESSFIFGDEDEHDVHTYAYSYPSSTRWSHAKTAIHEALTPIRMEIAVPHSLLVQFKNTYKCKHIKRKLGQMFHLNLDDCNDEDPKKNRNNENCNGNDIGNVDNNVDEAGDRNISSDSKMDENRLHPICSNIQDRISSHPMWNHVDECINDLKEQIELLDCGIYGSGPTVNDQHANANESKSEEIVKERERIQRDKIWNEICLAMCIQCKIVSKLNNDNNSNEDEAIQVLLASASLNPNYLIPLPKNENNHDVDDPGMDTSTGGILGISKYTDALPRSLPKNSLLMYFSDGSTRVSTALHQLLLQNDIISDSILVEEKTNRPISGGSTHSDKFAKRFDDNVFNVLGSDNKIDSTGSNKSKHSEENGGAKVKLKMNMHMLPNNSNHSISKPPLYNENQASGGMKFSPNGTGTGTGTGNGFKKVIKNQSEGLVEVSTSASASSSASNSLPTQLKGFIQSNSNHGSKGVVHGSFTDAFDSFVTSAPGQRSYGASLVSSTEPSVSDSDSDETTELDNNGEDGTSTESLPFNSLNINSDCESGATKTSISEVAFKMHILDEEIVRLHHVLLAEEEALKRSMQEQNENIEFFKIMPEKVNEMDEEMEEIIRETRRVT